MASLSASKTVSKTISYVGDTITYYITLKNLGPTPIDNVVITDVLPPSLTYVAGSLLSTVPVTGDPTTTINLTNSIGVNQVVGMNFSVLVASMPVPNPIKNVATLAFSYNEGGEIVLGNATIISPATVIFKNNYSQEINDLIASVALEEAALANIQNAEGAKIQKFAAMPGMTPEMLLCLNKSVAETTDSMTILESILRQKLDIVACQINGKC